jgi:hypothetical protein
MSDLKEATSRGDEHDRFYPADALWALCMACNVELTFFHQYNAEQLRHLEWRYTILCYGVPLIPAFTLLFIRDEDKGRAYGPAIVSQYRKICDIL